jgi:hypothetical protein
MAGELVHNDVLDAALNIIKNNATQMSVCIATPTTYTHATTTDAKVLAIVSDLTSADFAVAEAGGGGRQITIAEQDLVPIIGTGSQNATHVCLCDVDDRLLYVTTCTLQSLTNGNTVKFPAWVITIGDPTAV